MISIKKRVISYLILCTSMIVSGCYAQSSAEQSVEVSERVISGKYSGYIASLKTNDSHYDIGRSLSSLDFSFVDKSIEVSWSIENSEIIDSQGLVKLEEYNIAGDLIEGSFLHEDLGVLILKGTLKESSFTGKIYFTWKEKSATMNFIASTNE